MKTSHRIRVAWAIASALTIVTLPAAHAQKSVRKTPEKTPEKARAKTLKPRVRPGIINTRVILGTSIGRVALGETQAIVRKTLGAPTISFKLNGGLSSDLWRSASARRWDGALHTFEVVYRNGVAIQIEATNPAFVTARGLGLKSSDDAWQRAYGKRDESKQYKYSGAKHDQGYDDWVSAGFALEYQFLQGHDGAPIEEEGAPIQMQTLIVHYKGVPVIPDPGGISPKA